MWALLNKWFGKDKQYFKVVKNIKTIHITDVWFGYWITSLETSTQENSRVTLILSNLNDFLWLTV